MGTNRKSISKKIRFEVFKRDKFTCQYCGRMVPDVILEVDHIKPVSKGGTNDIMNLITSCKECNRGKGATELSDDSTIKKQQRQITELAEKNEQLELLLKWKDGLLDIREKEIDAIASVFERRTNYRPSAVGMNKIDKWLSEFTLSEILDAAEIAIKSYYDGSSESWIKAFNKVSGICHNKRSYKGNSLYYYNYLRKCCYLRYGRCNDSELKRVVKLFVEDDEAFEFAKSGLDLCSSFYVYMNWLRGE